VPLSRFSCRRQFAKTWNPFFWSPSHPPSSIQGVVGASLYKRKQDIMSVFMCILKTNRKFSIILVSLFPPPLIEAVLGASLYKKKQTIVCVFISAYFKKNSYLKKIRKFFWILFIKRCFLHPSASMWHESDRSQMRDSLIRDITHPCMWHDCNTTHTYMRH